MVPDRSRWVPGTRPLRLLLSPGIVVSGRSGCRPCTVGMDFDEELALLAGLTTCFTPSGG